MLCRGLFGRLVPDVSKTAAFDVSQLSRSFHQLSLARNLSRTPQSLRNGSALSFQSLGGCRTFVVTAYRPAGTARTRTPAKKKAGKTTSRAKPATKKKAAPKKKPAKKAKSATKKKPAKKATPRRRVLTEKQKAAREAKKTKDKIKDLKAVALPTVPKEKPRTAWAVYNAEHLEKGAFGPDQTKANAPKFKALSPAELEHYNHIANQNKAENLRVYRAWLNSHTPEQIRQANNARARLRRTAKHPQRKNLKRIVDERVPKKPTTSYGIFVEERFASGDLKGMPIASTSKLVAGEWKALNATEKAKYKSDADSLRTAYNRELKSALGA